MVYTIMFLCNALLLTYFTYISVDVAIDFDANVDETVS